MASFNPFSLEGKTILVTGASSGIGRGIAVTCSKMGATVVINGRNERRLAETFALMEGCAHQIAPADLSDNAKTAEMVSALPKLDGVVHCAGILERMLAKQLMEEDVDKIMDINFKAPVLLQSLLLQKKKINKGASIVFIASLGADSPNMGNSIYSASKGALISFANCLMEELAPRLIRVNCISPAMVWTDLAFDNMITEEQLKEDEQRYPLKRYGKPEDIANLAVYMLSDASSWMTGTNVKITGGGR